MRGRRGCVRSRTSSLRSRVVAGIAAAVLAVLVVVVGPVVVAGAEAAENTTVEIADRTYGVGELKVQVGDTVTWNNADEARHSVTSTTGSELASDLFGRGESFSYTFATPGTFAYFCEVHPEMRATIVVAPAPAAPVPNPQAPPAPAVSTTVTDVTLDPLLVVFAITCAVSVAGLLAIVSGAQSRPSSAPSTTDRETATPGG